MKISEIAAATMPPDMPDRVAVWDFDEFKRSMMAVRALVFNDLKAGGQDTFSGLRIFVDQTLPPGVIQLRRGDQVIRTLKVE